MQVLNLKMWGILWISLLFLSQSTAQKNDYIWPMGSYGFGTLNQILADSVNKIFWPFSLNFTNDPMKIDYFPYRRFIFDATNSMYGDDDGQLYCYTNGMQVFGADDQAILGGDTINFGEYWKESVHWQTKDKFGFAQKQGIIILPVNIYGKPSLYIISLFFDTDLSETTAVWYSILDMTCDGGKGCITQKDKIHYKAKIKGNMLHACRHGNGRDWWVIAISDDGKTYYTSLLDGTGLRLVHTQHVGKGLAGLTSGNATFSQQGDKYAVTDGAYWDSIGVVSIYDFDRCTGMLSNGFFDTLVIPEASLGQSAIFSPDGGYFYANNRNDLFQYDLRDFSKPRQHIATYDGFHSDPGTPGWRATPFGFWAPGPDGRLYNVSGAASAKHLHVMDYPNEEGVSCTFRQHAIRIPNNPFSIPNFPHYRLGPLDGSSCDTLGLDNHPIAKYRYEADSTDHLRLRFTDLSYFRPETWSWDFGDGSPRISTRSPYHTFAQNGTYRVCLTVSNENSSNTSCRTITLGTSSSDDEAISRADVSLFPNPVQDYLLITLGEYVPSHGQVMIYDVTGKPVITQRIYYGQNSVDMSALPAGMYVWKLMDGEIEVRSGKVVKI